MKTIMTFALLVVGSVSVASENNDQVMRVARAGIVQFSQGTGAGSFHYVIQDGEGAYTGGLSTEDGKGGSKTEKFSPKQAEELFTKLQKLYTQQRSQQ